MDRVAFLKCSGSFEETLMKAIDLIGGIGKLGSPLVLKPNLCTGDDHTGCANVKVEVVEALVELILMGDRDIEIRIVESDSTAKYADKTFEKYGYRAYVNRLRDQGVNISIHNLSKSPLTKIDYDGYYFKQPEMPSPLTDADCFASIALAKTHRLTVVTGMLKNMFGLLPRKDQNVYHPKIHEVILDLNRMFRSSLCLIDGRMGLEGVIKGNPRNLGCVILGQNPVSVDATMARVMGFDPTRIRHIVESERHGLGSIHPEVLGDDPGSYVVEFKKPSRLELNAVIG